MATSHSITSISIIIDSWVVSEEAPYLGDAVIVREGRFATVVGLDSTFWFAVFVVKENPETPAAKPTSEIIDRMDLLTWQCNVWFWSWLYLRAPGGVIIVEHRSGTRIAADDIATQDVLVFDLLSG